MAITLTAFSGTYTVSTTEWSMTANTAGPNVCTTAGCFQAFVDLSALAGSDVYELNIYEKVLSAGSQKLVSSVSFSGAVAVDAAGTRSIAVPVTPTLMLGIGWDMTLVKVQGTDRSLSWRIAQVA
jgi:hypothetical protein